MPIQKLAVSGCLRAGKDDIADYCGFKKLGFADPMYQIADHFFGKKTPKDQKRTFLQYLGQAGWGKVDDDVYALTPQRALFIDHMRMYGNSMIDREEFPNVNWKRYGTTKTFWVEIFIDRVARRLKQDKNAKIAVVNVRFDHELEPLKAAGFEHYHVMASMQSIIERLDYKGLVKRRADEPFLPALSWEDGYFMRDEQDLRSNLRGWSYSENLIKQMTDTSEQFAIGLNNTVKDSRVIWNDHRKRPDGRDFLTRDEFKGRAQ
jgi:hypothetical protein